MAKNNLEPLRLSVLALSQRVGYRYSSDYLQQADKSELVRIGGDAVQQLRNDGQAK